MKYALKEFKTKSIFDRDINEVFSKKPGVYQLFFEWVVDNIPMMSLILPNKKEALLSKLSSEILDDSSPELSEVTKLISSNDFFLSPRDFVTNEVVEAAMKNGNLKLLEFIARIFDAFPPATQSEADNTQKFLQFWKPMSNFFQSLDALYNEQYLDPKYIIQLARNFPQKEKLDPQEELIPKAHTILTGIVTNIQKYQQALLESFEENSELYHLAESKATEIVLASTRNFNEITSLVEGKNRGYTQQILPKLSLLKEKDI